MEDTKKTYNSPTLKVYGDVTDLTLGGKNGGFLDAAFPVGTPFADLTFS